MDPTAGAFTETKLFDIPGPSGQAPLAMATADGQVAAVVDLGDGRFQMSWNAELSHPFDEFVAMADGQRLFWSSDKRHVAMIGRRGTTQLVWHDGVEDPPFGAVSRSVPPTFSRDGAHLVYAGLTGERSSMVLDGLVIDEGPVAPIAAVWSPDGRRLAYARLRQAERRHEIVIDRMALPALVDLPNDPGVLQFSPDSTRFAYYTKERSGDAYWVVDGIPGRAINHSISELSLSRLRGIGTVGTPMRAGFSPDSRHFAHWADVKEKGVAIIADDEVGPVVLKAGSPVFSSDSQHLAYSVESFSKKAAIVRDGVVGREAPGSCGDPVFSPDSARLAHTIEHEAGGFLQKHRVYGLEVDGVQLVDEAGEDASRWPVFSPDSRHVAWWLQRKGEGLVYVDDRPVIRGLGVQSEPLMTSTGRVVCAMETAHGPTVFVDGTPGPASVALQAQTAGNDGSGRPNPGNPHFRVSPDGDHVVWAGRFGEGIRPVCDQATGPVYDSIFSSGFGDDSSPFWLGCRAGSIFEIHAG